MVLRIVTYFKKKSPRSKDRRLFLSLIIPYIIAFLIVHLNNFFVFGK